MIAQVDKYILYRKLGTGASSDVWEAFYHEHKYALKCLVITEMQEINTKNLKLFHNESKILSKLSHPNIVILHEANHNAHFKQLNGEEIPTLYLAIELASAGDLFDYVAHTGYFSEVLARHYFKVLVNVLTYIHLQGYAHRDLKLENLLLSDDYELKVADFGMTSTNSLFSVETHAGITSHLAPEMHVKGQCSGTKVDMFALGVVLFTMVVGYRPFMKASVQDKWYRMFYFDKEKFWMNVEFKRPDISLSTDIKDLINGLLEFKSELRLSIEEVKAHPWFNGVEISNEMVKKEMGARQDKLVLLGVNKK